MTSNPAPDQRGARRRVASPCISVCLLGDDDVCTGCYRSVREITDWYELDDAARLQVIDASRIRMRAAGVLFE